MEEMQSTKERLAQFERISVIGAMSSLIAHEINGPVSAISNSCSALERALEDDPDRSRLPKTTKSSIRTVPGILSLCLLTDCSGRAVRRSTVLSIPTAPFVSALRSRLSDRL